LYIAFKEKICYNYICKEQKRKSSRYKKNKKMLDRIKKICYNNNIEKEKEKVKPLKTFKKK